MRKYEENKIKQVVFFWDSRPREEEKEKNIYFSIHWENDDDTVVEVTLISIDYFTWIHIIPAESQLVLSNQIITKVSQCSV